MIGTVINAPPAVATMMPTLQIAFVLHLHLPEAGAP